MPNTPNTPSYLMQIAIETGKNTVEDVPVGCIIVRDNEILARAHNVREERQDPTGHAEIVAIQEAARKLNCWRLDGASLYTTLEPCPMCAEAIIQVRIERVFFGAYDQKSGACGSAFNLFKKGRIYPVPEVIGGIEEEVCQNLLKTYFETKVRNQE